MAVKEAWRGRFFEDFEVSDVYEHPLGRMISTTDNFWFTLISQNTAPMLFLFHESQDHHRSLLPERDHTQVEPIRASRSASSSGYAFSVVSDCLQLVFDSLACLVAL
jgi:hypothetical protein